MQITINDTAFEVPFDTSKITLGQFMQYHDEYGRDLNKLLAIIQAKEFTDDTEKIIEMDDFLNKEALAWFSFWTKTDLFEVKDEPFTLPLLHTFRQLRQLIMPEEAKFPVKVQFNDETWVLPDYKVTPSSNIDFNEIITPKEILRQLKTIEKDKYDALPYLCAIFLRKEDEAFTDEMIDDEGPRMALINELPLNVAFNVAFFLNSYQNISSKLFLFSMEKTVETLSLS